jgi:DNA-binding NtrC family response regulator
MMRDDLSELLAGRAPNPARPLLGLTLLLVEDSRFASEAVRLMCMRSGARFRRADCLASAARHLQTYRPMAVIVDLGLPDGSGLDLIGQLSALQPHAPAVLATSGDPALEDAARSVGADAFLEKPLESLATFQNTLLSALSVTGNPSATRCHDPISPDPLALRDDLAHAADMLGRGPGLAERRYLARFLSGVALGAHDPALAAAAAEIARDSATDTSLGRLSSLVQDRLTANAAF